MSGYKIEFSGSIYEKMLVSDRPFILFYVFQQHFCYEIEYIITSKVRTSYKTSHVFFPKIKRYSFDDAVNYDNFFFYRFLK